MALVPPTLASAGTSTLTGPFLANDPRIAGLLANIPRSPLPAYTAPAALVPETYSPLAEAAAPAAGRFAAGTLGRAGIYGGAGIIGGQLENKLVGEHPNTSWDEAATGAITGAGIGAGIGSVVPIPGVGTGLGALAGGLIGGALGLFGPKQSGPKQVSNELAKQTAQLTGLAQQLGIDSDTTAQLGAQLQAVAYQAGNKGQVAAAAAQLAQQLPALAQQQLQERQQQMSALAVQSAMQQFMQPYLQSAATQQEITHQQENQAADRIGGDLGALLRTHAQQTAGEHANLLAAYATQVAMAPQTQQYDTLTQLRNQANSQLYAKLAGSAAGNGQPTTLTQYLASQGQ